jgi:dihydroorotate dehydrogenase electron transfer subunit
MKQVIATVIAKGEPIQGLNRPHGQSIRFSQTISLNCPEIVRGTKPGQFVMVRCGDECILPRPFSIHQVNAQGYVLYYAVLEDGKGTNWLSQRSIGDAVHIFGPLGNGFFINPSSRNLLLIAGGMGIAPLYYLAEDAKKKRLKVTMLYGTAIDYPYPSILQGLELVRTTEDGSVGYRGMATDLLPYYIDHADQIFACGPLPMYRTMAHMPELKNKPVQVSLEVRMGCGTGICYGCTVKTAGGLKQVCKDGPVFDLHEISWDALTLL